MKGRHQNIPFCEVQGRVPGAGTAGTAPLELDVEAGGGCQRRQYFVQLRYALTAAGIKLPERLPGHVSKPTNAIGGAFEHGIVKDGKMPINKLQIALDGMYSEVFGEPEPDKRVFWRKTGCATMPDYHKISGEGHTMGHMSYEVLARRLRPRSFDELIGQEHVVRVLRHALDHGRLHHAYLFTGTRGVGKTTIARILAKCMNCETGVTSTPCLQCSICEEISAGRFPDLVEVDAASRTKVEQTRELLENVPYAPTRGRFKVYLIDEVHMLSQSSFNALLKTLEEPPDHVRFLLATTDAKKVPVTVLSRCLQLQLKNLLPERIAAYLESVLEADEVEFDKPSLEALARAGRGSMRDALSLTDQAIAYCGGALKDEEVHRMMGAVRQESLDALMSALIAEDAAATMEAIAGLAELGVDFTEVLAQLTSIFHQAAVRQALGETGGAPVVARLAAWRPDSLQLAYQIAIIAARDLPLAPDARCGFEMAMLRLLAFRPVDAASPQQQGSMPPTSGTEPVKASASTSNADTSPADDRSVESSAASVNNVRTLQEGVVRVQTPLDWHRLSAALEADPLVIQLARNAWCAGWDGRILHLGVDRQYELSVEQNRVQGLKDAVRQVLGKDVDIRIRFASPEQETPIARDKRIEQGRVEKARALLEADPRVRCLVGEFGATIEPESIELTGVHKQ